MNRKSFLTTLLMAIAAPFLPNVAPDGMESIKPPYSGPLIDEGFGTTRSNPEVIAPLDQLRQRINLKVIGRSRAIEIKGSVPLEYFKVNKHPANNLGYNEFKIKRNRLN